MKSIICSNCGNKLNKGALFYGVCVRKFNQQDITTLKYNSFIKKKKRGVVRAIEKALSVNFLFSFSLLNNFCRFNKFMSMKRLCVVLFLFLIVGSTNLYSQSLVRASEGNVRIALIKNWSRMPTNAEINRAYNEYRAKAYSYCNVGNWQKMHTPWSDNGDVANHVIVINSCTYSSPQRNIKYAAILKFDYNTSTFKFEGVLMKGVKKGDKNATASRLEEQDLVYLSPGWISSTKNNQNSNKKTSPWIDNNPNKIDEDYDDDDDSGLLTIVIGALTAAGLLAIRNRIKKKKKATSTGNKKKPKEKKEVAEYILQLNTEAFYLKLDETKNLTAKVWKITEKGKSLANATIKIQCSEKALKVMPFSAAGTLNSQITLKDKPKENQFYITVATNVDGHTYQKRVRITAGMQKRLIIETAPDNIRSLRPNIDQNLTCFAQVVDEEDNDIPELTKKIKFDNSKDRWVDLLDEGPYFDEGWAAILVGASDPAEDYDISHPPKSVTLGIYVDYEEEEKNIRLENNLKIDLIDCKLETDLEQVSFLATKEQSKITIKANIKDCDGTKPWKFKAVYMKDYETVDKKPLSTIDLQDVKDSEVKIALTGPILLPKEGEQFIRKLLVISAQQKEEKALERHIYVLVSREGLFIQNGVNSESQIEVLANGKVKNELVFELYTYHKEKDEIIVDIDGLKNLKLELATTDDIAINVNGVFKPEFSEKEWGHSETSNTYIFQSENEIPADGRVVYLKYKVSAPIPFETKNPENFQVEFTVQLKTLDIGKVIPTWNEAYENCKFIINKHIPYGETREILLRNLEVEGVFLDVEGLVEFRNRVWEIAQDLILLQGEAGYKNLDEWYTLCIEVRYWAKMASDVCVSILMIVYFRVYGKVGMLLLVPISVVKEIIYDAIVYYRNDEGTIEKFKDQQYQKIIYTLFDVTQGKLITPETIGLAVKNKPLAWAIFVGIQFAINLYRTESMVEAIKATATQITLAMFIDKTSKYIIANPDKCGGLKLVNHLQKGKGAYPNTTDPKKSKKIATEDKEFLDNFDKKTHTDPKLKLKYLDKSEVSKIMKDPAKVRTIKEHGTDAQKSAFVRSRKKIYDQHDRALKQEMVKKFGGKLSDYQLDDFRTPGPVDPTGVNTDRDLCPRRRIRLKNGKDVMLEFKGKQLDDIKSKSENIFGNLTDKPSNVSAKKNFEDHQQRITNQHDNEASRDYGKNFIDPKTGEYISDSHIKKVYAGKSTLKSPKSQGDMILNKVLNNKGPEKIAQAKKGVSSLKKIYKSYKKQGYKVPKIEKKLEKAMSLIEKAKVTKEQTPVKMKKFKEALNKLNYKDIDDVANHLKDKITDLGNVEQPSFFDKIKGFTQN
ncbi:hypothetical protein [Polaribacter sp.]|uniref:hypothetical protein n=1 Tax=Polaribacter sp. TaxID=1920175 RepID=UPI003EF6E214